MLRRRPRGLNWKREDYLIMNASEYAGINPPVLDEREIARYQIGYEQDNSRSDCPACCFLHVCVEEEHPVLPKGYKNVKQLYIGR